MAWGRAGWVMAYGFTVQLYQVPYEALRTVTTQPEPRADGSCGHRLCCWRACPTLRFRPGFASIVSHLPSHLNISNGATLDAMHPSRGGSQFLVQSIRTHVAKQQRADMNGGATARIGLEACRGQAAGVHPRTIGEARVTTTDAREHRHCKLQPARG